MEQLQQQQQQQQQRQSTVINRGKRLRGKSQSNNSSNKNKQQEQTATITTTTTTKPQMKAKTFTAFKFNQNAKVLASATTTTTTSPNIQQQQQLFAYNNENNINSGGSSSNNNTSTIVPYTADATTDTTSSSSTFSSSSQQHSLDYEAEDEYEDKSKRPPENENLVQVQNFLKCFAAAGHKPNSVVSGIRCKEAITATSALVNSALLTAMPCHVDDSDSARTSAYSSQKSSRAVSYSNSVVAVPMSVSSLPSGNINNSSSSSSSRTTFINSLPTGYDTGAMYVSNDMAATFVEGVETNANSIAAMQRNVAITDSAAAAKPTSTSLELRNYRANYRHLNTTATTIQSASNLTTMKPQKFQISPKFLRKPRNKLKMLPIAAALPKCDEQQQLQQEEQQQQQQQHLLQQQHLFNEDSNAKFKDFSIDSLLNK